MKQRALWKMGLWILVISAGFAGTFAAYRYFTQEKKSEVSYEEATVARGDIQITILSTGIVQPENRLEIKPPIAGRVEQLLVDEGANVKKGDILAWMSSTERAALIDAASAKGKDVVKEWEELFRPTPIIAPITGSIIKRNVESGQTFGTGEAVFVMSDRLTVKAQVDETDMAQVSLKQKAMITLDAYPQMPMPGHVDKIAFDATTVNNVTTYIVDVIPEHTPKVMRSGMTANVTFEVQTKKDTLFVPANALKVRDGATFILLPSKEKDAEPVEHEIETGISNGKQVELISGLNENDPILVPVFKIKESNTATNPFSPMRRPPPKKPAT